MEIFVTAIIVSGLVLSFNGLFGLGACAFMAAAFTLWWSGQPGAPIDIGLYRE